MLKFTRNKIVIICIIIFIISLVVIVSHCILFKPYSYYDKDCEDFPEVVDRAPLIRVDENNSDRYVLVMSYCDDNNKRLFFYIDNYELLKDNRESFIITNDKQIYYITADWGYTELYKGGELIDSEIFIPSSKINYGTLENEFTETSKDEISYIINKE